MTKKFVLSILLIFSVILSGCSGTLKRLVPKRPTDRETAKNGLTTNPKNDTPRIDEDGYCENAQQPLRIHTYDGSDQENHPKVLYFKQGWHGWRYWMSFTPYPYCDADYENPSIAVSNDGVRWSAPKGMPEPVIKPPADVNNGGHYSDPHLVMNGQYMQLWYRYNPTNRRRTGTSHSINRIYMIETRNGTAWSRPLLIFNDQFKYYSPAVIFDGSKYRVWFSNDNGKLYYRESSDLKRWSQAVATGLVLPGYCVWHQDVIKTDIGYQIVFSAYKHGFFGRNNQCLYYAVSQDGLHFNSPVKILSPSRGTGRLDDQMIYRSSIVDVDGAYKIYYSAMNHNREWHIFQTRFAIKDMKPFAA